MPRKARNVVPNTPMHITQRGNRKENIFRDEQDKEFYIRSFMKYRKKYKKSHILFFRKINNKNFFN